MPLVYSGIVSVKPCCITNLLPYKDSTQETNVIQRQYVVLNRKFQEALVGNQTKRSLVGNQTKRSLVGNQTKRSLVGNQTKRS
uniref:Uncharacterized protein n=1 Tax=Octopus bimaculoides TaxID=37653 RepID=A0A0L8G9E3_OCTBM